MRLLFLKLLVPFLLLASGLIQITLEYKWHDRRTKRHRNIRFTLIAIMIIATVFTQFIIFKDFNLARQEGKELKNELKELREINVPIRKLIIRITYKTSEPTLICFVEVWRNTAGFSIFRKKIKVQRGEFGLPKAFDLSVSEDASFVVEYDSLGRKSFGSFQSPVDSEPKVLEELPIQFRKGIHKSFLETRVILDEGLFTHDLLLGHILFSFYFFRESENNITSRVLDEINKIQVYADAIDKNIVLCTYMPDVDKNLVKDAFSEEEETWTENKEGYMFHRWPSRSAFNLSEGLSIVPSAKPFHIIDRQQGLEKLPNYDDS